MEFSRELTTAGPAVTDRAYVDRFTTTVLRRYPTLLSCLCCYVLCTWGVVGGGYSGAPFTVVSAPLAHLWNCVSMAFHLQLYITTDWYATTTKNQEYFARYAKSTKMPIAPITIRCSAFSSSGYPLTPPPCTWIVNRGIKSRVMKDRNRYTIMTTARQSVAAVRTEIYHLTPWSMTSLAETGLWIGSPRTRWSATDPNYYWTPLAWFPLGLFFKAEVLQTWLLAYGTTTVVGNRSERVIRWSSGVARNLRQGVCMVVLPLSSLPFPLPFPPLFRFPLLPLRSKPP